MDSHARTVHNCLYYEGKKHAVVGEIVHTVYLQELFFYHNDVSNQVLYVVRTS